MMKKVYNNTLYLTKWYA